MHKKRAKIRKPSWTESKNAAGLAAAMLLMFLGYTFFMFSYFQYPGFPLSKGTAGIYLSTISVLTLGVIGAALLVKFLKRHHKADRDS